jgi:hypothetical protein
MILTGSVSTAYCDVIWDWSFASETGQFQTDGFGSAPGTYVLIDFSVTSSSTGGTIGSLAGGAYSTPILSTSEPFSFVWDGTQVTQWLHSGLNGFDWWVFADVANPPEAYFFGSEIGSVNDPTRAGHWAGSNLNPLAAGDVTVSPSSVSAIPEPSALLLLGTGVVACWILRRLQ